RVRKAVPEDAHRLRELLGIRVLDARIPDLGPVEDAPKGLRGHRDVSCGRAAYHPPGQPNTHADGDTEEHGAQAGSHSFPLMSSPARTLALVARIICRVQVLEAQEADSRHLGDVLRRFGPVDMKGITRQDQDAPGRIRSLAVGVEFLAEADV